MNNPLPPSIAPRRRAAFTLIELLTVIAIIGILAAILIPTIGSVREKAQRTVDGNNLREIAKAAMLYASDNNDRLPDPASAAGAALGGGSAVYRWPALLAKQQLLIDSSFYFAKNDPEFSGDFPAAVVDPASPGRNEVDAQFAAGLLAWEFVGGVKMGDPATTPVAFTRGLQANGTWDAASGVYRDTGGFVAYLGGNVVFYHDATHVFTAYGTGRKVSDVRKAIPPNAKIYATPTAAGTVLGTPEGTAAVRDE